MLHPPLDRGDDLPGIALEPEPIEPLGHDAELHEEIPREILQFSFAALLSPQAQEGSLVTTHNYSGV